jgi:Fe-S oxidoreductase
MDSHFILTPVEQMIFILLALFAVGATYQGFVEMYNVINRGEGKLHFDRFFARAFNALSIYLSQRTTLKARPISSLFHLGIVWGFTFYLLVNLVDVARGFVPGFSQIVTEDNLIWGGYRLIADVLSVAVLVGMTYFLLRRFVLPQKKELDYHDNVLLHPKVASGGIKRDSLIVGVFMLLHVGGRFLGEAAYTAGHGFDPYMPFASTVGLLFAGFSPSTLLLMEHLFWWLALGGILLFTPYFPYTKHAHLFMAPLNFLTKPERTSLGEMEKIDLEAEKLGVEKIEDLPKTNIFDAFACIMCNRCQDVCPAYVTGKELSPSALEINKRYLIKDQMIDLSNGEASLAPLIGSAISESAVWACTACGACVDICPVGNEPMRDILNIRREQALMQGSFPKDLGNAFKGMERQGNPWGSPEPRFNWAKGLDFAVPTIDENPEPDILYWTGCAVSYDPRAQLTARAFVKILNKAGVNFAVLGDAETCTGDAARRAGREDLYEGFATQNVETLNEIKPKRIAVTCPHCFHNIGKEYPQFGGNYEVVHHTTLIEELIAAGKVPLSAHPNQQPNVTFHDPCYLGRHNGVIDAPRNALSALNGGSALVEMPRTKKNSFCCGAGGAQFWKEEEHGTKAVNVERYEEATKTGAEVLAVGCPFCAQMFESAKANLGTGPVIKDVAELIADRLDPNAQPLPTANGGSAVAH